MRRNRGAVKYAGGMATSRVGLVNMYIYGGTVLSLLTFLLGLLTSGSVATAISVVFEFYISRVVPWPPDEILLAETLVELAISHTITIGVGLTVATSKWWKNV